MAATQAAVEAPAEEATELPTVRRRGRLAADEADVGRGDLAEAAIDADEAVAEAVDELPAPADLAQAEMMAEEAVAEAADELPAPADLAQAEMMADEVVTEATTAADEVAVRIAGRHRGHPYAGRCGYRRRRSEAGRTG